MKRLSKTGIEYLDYCWNFLSGCRHKEQGKCPPVPCWAKEMAGRFKGHYPNGFTPTFYPEALLSPLALKKPARIGVCFMGDLFGDWIGPYFNASMIMLGLDTIKKCPQHTFVFLTKNPAGMRAWSPFPGNCEVGFSAWSPDSFVNGLREIMNVKAKVRWCSLEPLLEWSGEVAGNAWELLDWVAIGALTGNKKQIMETARLYPALTPWKLSASTSRWGLMPPVEWLRNIVEGCDAAGTKVFIKDNLKSWIEYHGMAACQWAAREWVQCRYPILRQECGAREFICK
jgi:protein gp37